MSENPRKCKARRHSDQWICHECGFVWDVNDPDPPVCGKGGPVLRQLPGERATITDISIVSKP